MSYLLREGLSGFQRAKLSTAISIVTITIALVLLGTFIIIFLNIHQFVESVRREVQIEIFVNDNLSNIQKQNLERKITDQRGVQSVTFISKDDAARIFQEEFGEDIFSVLDFNPLPASFRVSLEPEYIHPDSAVILAANFEKLDGVDSVVYHTSLLEMLTRRIQLFITVSAGIGILLGIAAIFLVSNTIRLAIFAKRRLIQTMRLVGATRSFIRKPFLLEGFLQGFLGGLFASIFLFGFLEIVRSRIPQDLFALVHIEFIFFGLIILAGSILGLLGSTVSIRRFLR